MIYELSDMTRFSQEILLEGGSNVCYSALYTDEIGSTVAATCNLRKRRTARTQMRSEAARVDITDSRRECDKYNAAERGQTELALIRSASKTSPPYAVIIPVIRYSADE